MLAEEAGTCQDVSKMRTPRFSKQVLQEASVPHAAEQLHWLRGVCSSISHATDARRPDGSIFSFEVKYFL